MSPTYYTKKRKDREAHPGGSKHCLEGKETVQREFLNRMVGSNKLETEFGGLMTKEMLMFVIFVLIFVDFSIVVQSGKSFDDRFLFIPG